MQRCLVEQQPVVFASWHNGILGTMRLLKQHVAAHGHWVSPLASRSRDGEMIAKLIGEMSRHVHVVRGSSKRAGTEALDGLEVAVRQFGASPVLTVDGPRGPRYEAKPGAVRIAWRTGVPLVPVAWAASHEVVIRSSWDAFRIPLPGSRVRFAFGPPLWVPAEHGEHTLPFWTARLDTRLMALTRALAPSRRQEFALGHDRGREKERARDGNLNFHST